MHKIIIPLAASLLFTAFVINGLNDRRRCERANNPSLCLLDIHAKSATGQ